MNKNDIIELTADNISEDGSGVGRHDGMVVFCRGMLPGERASVRIIKVTSSYAVGKMLSLSVSSPHRLEPPLCPHFTKGCGGCAFCHLDMGSQLAFKKQRVIDCLTRIGGFPESCADAVCDVIAADLPFGYRNKSIYPFARQDGRVVCGFYALNSHRVVPLGSGCGTEDTERCGADTGTGCWSDAERRADAGCATDAGCRIENEMSRQIRNFTLKFANEHGLTAYDETSGRGLLRALMVRTNHGAAGCGEEDEAMAVLIVNMRVPKPGTGGQRVATARAGAVQEALPEVLKLWADELTGAFSFVMSVWICFNSRKTNVVLDGDMVHVRGERTICDTIGSFEGAPHFRISPLSFYQVNPAQTERLYGAVYDLIPKNARMIYDIYCGIGTIGIYLAARMACEGRRLAMAGTDAAGANEDLNVCAGAADADESTAAGACEGAGTGKGTGVKIVGVECVPSAVGDANKNAAENGITNAFYYCGDASDVTPRVIEEHGVPSVIILDPPRKGCDTSLLDTVIASGSECIIYISCNPATLARDLKVLCAVGYEIRRVQPVDMFPESGHVETVCLLSKMSVE